MKSFFLNFIDKTYSEMRNKSFLFGNGDKLLYTTPIRELITKEAVTMRAGITIQEAASVMSGRKISSLILVDSNEVPVGIVTDRDLRDKVVAKGLVPSTLVDEIMSPPLIRVDANEICFEALIKMIRYNVHHLIVIENGRLKGVITNHDFMVLQGTSPLSLVKSIESQKDISGLVPISERINRIVSILVKEGGKAGQIVKIISELNDRLFQRILELGVKEFGKSPVPLAFVLYGSEGRKEQTFKTVLDWAIVFDEPKTSIHGKSVEEYCKNFIEHLDAVFRKCGLPTFEPHPFGRERSIFGSIGNWQDIIFSALLSTDEELINNANKFLDLRHIHGDESISSTLKEQLICKLKNNNSYLTALMKIATRERSPLGFFKTFVVERSGEHRYELNIKEKGMLPIIDSIRALAVVNGIQAISTLARLDRLAGDVRELADMSDDIAAAFEFLLHLRIQDQLKKKEFNEEIDDFIDPSGLSMLEKKTLKEVFQIIPGLQDIVTIAFDRMGVEV